MRTAYTVDGHKVTVVTEIRENVFEVMQHFLWEHGDEDEEYTEEYSSIYHGRLFDDPPCKATHSKLKELEVQVKQHQELIGNLNDEISRLQGVRNQLNQLGYIDGIGNLSDLFANKVTHVVAFPEREYPKVIPFNQTMAQDGSVIANLTLGRNSFDRQSQTWGNPRWVMRHHYNRDGTTIIPFTSEEQAKEKLRQEAVRYAQSPEIRDWMTLDGLRDWLASFGLKPSSKLLWAYIETRQKELKNIEDDLNSRRRDLTMNQIEQKEKSMDRIRELIQKAQSLIGITVLPDPQQSEDDEPF